MSCSDLPPYLLQELPDITESINYPIKNVQRIKYTCFDISKSLIAFGATSGGIYVFNRTPCEFVQLIPNKDGAITRLAISKDEKQIGFANGRGLATVTECNQSLSGGHSTVVSKEHQGNEITAMIWSTSHMLFMGDDVGKISVLQPQNFIAKTMFQSSSLTIMSLDSRICQLDMKSSMLLVSTLTRCYVCDTSREQYRQIGQKLRDGEYGACFVDKKTNNEQHVTKTTQDFTEVRKYNIVNDDSGFAVGKDLENTLIFCARPSSRVWEATIDGTVIRTHQFKQVLGKKAMKLVSNESYQNEKVSLDATDSDTEGQSVNFPNIFATNGAIFSYRRNALYFLNIYDVDHTIWFDNYKDIVDCKAYHDMIYVWLSNGSLVNLKYMKVDKFLVKCYVDEKYVLCAELCALYRNYLLESNLSQKLHILVSLRDKLENKELLDSIKEVLDKFEGLKSNDATQLKSGIYIVDNTYHAQSSLLEGDTKLNDDFKFTSLPPEAMQTLKDLSLSVSDKLNSSKKILKEKWEEMKHLSVEKHHEVKEVPVVEKEETQVVIKTKTIDADDSIEHTPIVYDNDIVYKESSQKAIEVDNNSLERDKVNKALYQYYKLSLVGKETDQSNLVATIENYACDISQIYSLMLQLESYCIHIGAFDESKFVPNNIFLSYLNESEKKNELLDTVIKDEVLYKYFVDSCISVNMKSQKLSNIGCDCGFPLPYSRTHQTPMFSELIDEFIEKQWSSQTRSQCYDVCKRMPYLWRKILYLRRNEDLLNILRLLLQMLDETLLHSFLPQFTLDTWERTVQLYATLHANMCLNCSKKFDHIIVKDTLSWDDLGALMIKSVGGRNAIKVMEKYASLIDEGAITVKFYHTCLMVTMYERYDATIVGQLTDTLYSCYNFEDSRIEICRLLRSTLNGKPKNTALPIIAAAKSKHWGLRPLTASIPTEDDEAKEDYILDASLTSILDNLSYINNNITDCVLCGLPLQNTVLIKDGGLWVFKCGHTFHGACLELNKIKLCPSCSPLK
ncbi:BLOC-2 complex member HPS5 homolog [Spodoptera frugiperda]|uniref:BLOC-2 complex member HPS5 homolog n=1 Tax=Spodoptera frugiperda TaxID=7108 RepID=A0A9R0D776_SPOFR|nr:BLOC-2 complex member HPS5 homolog [Spodoptera frugiperda]